MATTRGQFAQLLAAGLFSVIYEDLAMHPEEYPEVFNHYFTNTTNFFVLGEKRDHTLKFYWRIQPEFASQDDFMTKGSSYSVYFRFIPGVTYWHGFYGSPGV